MAYQMSTRPELLAWNLAQSLLLGVAMQKVGKTAPPKYDSGSCICNHCIYPGLQHDKRANTKAELFKNIYFGVIDSHKTKTSWSWEIEGLVNASSSNSCHDWLGCASKNHSVVRFVVLSRLCKKKPLCFLILVVNCCGKGSRMKRGKRGRQLYIVI